MALPLEVSLYIIHIHAQARPHGASIEVPKVGSQKAPPRDFTSVRSILRGTLNISSALTSNICLSYKFWQIIFSSILLNLIFKSILSYFNLTISQQIFNIHIYTYIQLYRLKLKVQLLLLFKDLKSILTPFDSSSQIEENCNFNLAAHWRE